MVNYCSYFLSLIITVEVTKFCVSYHIWFVVIYIYRFVTVNEKIRIDIEELKQLKKYNKQVRISKEE